MASVHVYIELVGRRPGQASLEALGEGRRIASYLGAALYAVLPCETPPNYGDDDVIAILGRHGADKVVLVAHPSLAEPTLYRPQGYAVADVCEALPPNLVLVAATEGGRDLAPRLATRLGAAFVPEPTLEYAENGTLTLNRAIHGGAFCRHLSVDDVERPIVMTLSPRAHATARGDEEAEVIVLESSPPPDPFEESGTANDAGAALDQASVVVTAGCGVDEDTFQLVCQLAESMGAEVAVTKAAANRGMGNIERTVDITARSISPRLYIACAASGSTAHLSAVSRTASIIAINNDPHAPILQRAHYAIVGDVETLLPQLIESLAKNPPAKSSETS